MTGRRSEDFVIRPGNITSVFDTQAIPVEKGTKGPHTDIANLGFDQELGRGWALSANYIYRKTTDYIVLTQYANQVTYEPVTYTSSVHRTHVYLFTRLRAVDRASSPSATAISTTRRRTCSSSSCAADRASAYSSTPR